MFLFLALACVPIVAQRGRNMPPSEVGCDRNNLTSYTGEVTQYSRKAAKIRLTIRTDEDTVERVSFEPSDKVLLDAQPMKDADWKRVEDSQGRLKAGMRATAWVCRGGRPVLDWQPPRR